MWHEWELVSPDGTISRFWERSAERAEQCANAFRGVGFTIPGWSAEVTGTVSHAQWCPASRFVKIRGFDPDEYSKFTMLGHS